MSVTRRRLPLTVIDVHAHAFPDHVAAGALAKLSGDAGIEGTYDGTIAGLRQVIAAAGIEQAILQPVASRPEQVASINRWAAGVRSETIMPFAALHPGGGDLAAAVDEIAAAGFLGFKLHPEYQVFEPDDPDLDPMYETATRRGLIVFYHAGEDLGIPTVHSTPAQFARVLDRHPRLTMVLAHMGGWRQWDDVRTHLVGRDVYLDTSFTLPYLGEEGFMTLVRAHGVERVVYGSDLPWSDAGAELARLRTLPFNNQELEAILWRNAEQLLASAGSPTEVAS